MRETEIVSCRVLNNKSYYHCFTAIKFAKPSWRVLQSMIPFIENPTELVGAMPLHLACARSFGRSKAPLGLLLLRKRELTMAGRAGSSCPQQRKTERSRRGTPCCTYRYCLWSLAGCVRVGVPCFFSVCLTNNHCVALTSKDSSFLMTLIRIVAISYRCHFECLGVSDVTRL